MRKMSGFVLGILACAAVAAAIVACKSCHISGKLAPMPEDIADAQLLSYSYTKHGTTRWPLYSERVERCTDNPTRCVIRLFDLNGENSLDDKGNPVEDTLVVSADVLDHVKQLIIEAEAWRFKDNYLPRMEIMDGWSWGFSASFELSPSVLAATPEADRPRLLRRGGRILSSSGSNAAPDTELFKKVRAFLKAQWRTENE